MFAVAVYHRTTPGLLKDGSPAALRTASRAWIDFLAGEPGFVEFISLANAGADRIVAVSLWQSEEDFRRAAGRPESAAARAGFAGLFTEVTPEFMSVEEYRRA